MGSEWVGLAGRFARAVAPLALFAAVVAAPLAAGAPGRHGGLADIAAESVADANVDGSNPSQAYRIQLSRPMKVGQRYAYTADATVVDSATGNLSGRTRTLKPRTASVHFDGEMEVLAVNVFGEPTRARFIVNECAARALKEKITVFERGTVVLAEAGRYKTKLSPDRGGMTIEEDMMARSVLNLPRVDGISDDELFGTTHRQKVGGAWSVNREKIVKSWEAQGARMKKESVSGTVRLKGIERVDGVACLRVNGKASIAEFTIPKDDVPEGTRVKHARSEIKFTRLSPINPSKYHLQDSYSSTTFLTLVTDEGVISPDMVVEAKWLRTVGATYRLLEDGVEFAAP
jgi:hypothetical protein